MSKINELIRLVQQAELSIRSPVNALDLLDKAQKLCLAAHKEEQYYRTLIMMHTGYSSEEIDMVLDDSASLNPYGEDVEVQP